jgi:hypothetical protein
MDGALCGVTHVSHVLSHDLVFQRFNRALLRTKSVYDCVSSMAVSFGIWPSAAHVRLQQLRTQ